MNVSSCVKTNTKAPEKTITWLAMSPLTMPAERA